MAHDEDCWPSRSVELRRRIGTKEISPVELLEACIARIEALNPAVNAIAATDYERAREEAKAAEGAALRGEPLGALHGLPTGIKDLHETEGLLTTYGSPLYRDFVPKRDAAMVALVRKAGAIVVAKTNVPEFGAGANTRNPVWGATGNPFDPRAQSPAARPAARPWRSPATCCRSAPAPTPAARCASRPPSAAWSASGPRPAWCRWTRARSAGRRSRCSARWAARSPTRACCSPRRSAWTTAIRWPSRCDPDAIASARPVDLGRLRVAWTEDFGQCPVGKRDPRGHARADRRHAPPVPRLRRGRASTSARPTAAST